MATKWGDDAWKRLAERKAAAKARGKVYVTIVAVIVIYLVLDHWFVG